MFTGLIYFSGCAGPIKSERLGTLLELKKEDERLSQTLEQEAKNFDTLHKAIVTHEIIRGVSRDLIKNKAGEPVIIYPEKEGEKWVYKKAGGNWLKGPKIYLFFNSTGEVSDYQCLRVECPAPA